MTKFLCVQHTYNGIEAALFNASENDCKIIDKIFEDKKRASKYFVTAIASLLENNGLKLDDLSFIATNHGPGPFTTLRVVLASVNGLAFAIKKPIIGIDGLDAILQEYSFKLDSEKKCGDGESLATVALLDACSKDVYFGVCYKNFGEQVLLENKGCKNIEILLQDLKKIFVDKQIYFIGNGSEKYKDQIVALFGDMAVFDKIIPATCSVEQVGKMAFSQWVKKEGLVLQVLPIYLKAMSLNLNKSV